MSPAVEAALASWRFEPLVGGGLLLAGWIYLRGRRSLARSVPERLPPWRAVAFLGGLAVFYVAVASPLDAFADLLLQVHMTQHFLLMMVAPPLLWMGRPALPLLHGLPVAFRRDGLGPFLRWSRLEQARDFLTHPVTCWCVFVGVTWLWHVPALYETALLDPLWHDAEHLSFFFGALLFWFPVLQPWPSRARMSRWVLVPYLVLASLQMTVLSALFVFSDRVFYPVYDGAPRLGGVSALDDQRVAGAILWVPGSLVLLTALMVLVFHLLSPRLVRPGQPARTVSAPLPPPRDLDLLGIGRVGSILRWSGTRRALQSILLVLALAIVADGFLGPRMAPMNLAGVLPWTWARALAVLGLLVVGNLFCFACPFMLPRALARRWFPAQWAWPVRLRSKWLAVVLVVLFLWTYEVFAPWNGPLWTAWILIAYFALALLVDGLFQGASFCKYVCPIGQFNFIGSLVSPLEVRARASHVCADCTTQDCIRGRPGAPGCELDLYLPTKVGNLDCTFCLDCVRACPHDNVGLVARWPGVELTTDPLRASFGRLGLRRDVVALALAIVFGAFANAAGMVEPVVAGMRRAAEALGSGEGTLVFTAFLLLSVVGAPALLVLTTSRWIGRAGGGLPEAAILARRLALALVPLGIAMWAAHLLFHLVSGAAGTLPVATRVARGLGLSLGEPDWSMAHAMGPVADGWISVQIVLLDVGLLSSLYLGWRIVRPVAGRIGATVGALLPWAATTVLLFAVGIWLLFQPMEMRGMLLP